MTERYRLQKDELVRRTQVDIDVFLGQFPERFQLAWHATLAALWEYGAIDQTTYTTILGQLPAPPAPQLLGSISAGRGSAPREPMQSDLLVEQLRQRIQANMVHHTGAWEEYSAIAWKAYLLGLRVWLVIGRKDYYHLVRLLPAIPEPDPTETLIRLIE